MSVGAGRPPTAFALASPIFLSAGHLRAVLQPIPEVALLAVGVTVR